MTNTDTLKQLQNKKVVVLAYDGLCTFEFGVAVEIFGLARPEMGSDWYKFAVASVDDGELRSVGGLRFIADGGLELLQDAGTIIIPGWRGLDAPVPEHLIGALKYAHQNGARILSICSGVFVLAASGLLNGKSATTHWRYCTALNERYPLITVVADVLYIDEGQLLTSAGSAAGIDLCLHLIRRDYGAKAANIVARRLVVPPHRDGGQAQFIEQAVPTVFEQDRLAPLLDLMLSNISADYSVKRLAMLSGMSERTFLRRFEAATGMTPSRWLLRERLRMARDLLENSSTQIEQIALTCGFGSATNFRHHFRQNFSTSPNAYRNIFSNQP